MSAVSKRWLLRAASACHGAVLRCSTEWLRHATKITNVTLLNRSLEALLLGGLLRCEGRLGGGVFAVFANISVKIRQIGEHGDQFLPLKKAVVIQVEDLEERERERQKKEEKRIKITRNKLAARLIFK